MKVQEVLMQAISGQLTWLEAEDILGWRPRTLRRWRLRYQQHGYDGLWDRRRQQPSPRCAPVAEVARITRLYREQYAGFNAAHFHEFAQRDHAVTLGYDLPSRDHGRHRGTREARPAVMLAFRYTHPRAGADVETPPGRARAAGSALRPQDRRAGAACVLGRDAERDAAASGASSLVRQHAFGYSSAG
jgi:hypothetical protein